MNNSVYWKSRGYAFKVCKQLDPRDILHNSYLKWFERKNSNLFEQDQALINQVLKMEYYEQVRQSKYKWRGEKYTKQFISVDETNENEEPLIQLEATGNTDDLVQLNEVKEQYSKYLPNILHGEHVFKLLEQGYKVKHIANKLNKGRTVITKVVKEIRQIKVQ